MMNKNQINLFKKKNLLKYDSNSRSWDLKPSANPLGQYVLALEKTYFL